jgi:hypothetical protein
VNITWLSGSIGSLNVLPVFCGAFPWFPAGDRAIRPQRRGLSRLTPKNSYIFPTFDLDYVFPPLENKAQMSVAGQEAL